MKNRQKEMRMKQNDEMFSTFNNNKFKKSQLLSTIRKQSNSTSKTFFSKTVINLFDKVNNKLCVNKDGFSKQVEEMNVRYFLYRLILLQKILGINLKRMVLW